MNRNPQNIEINIIDSTNKNNAVIWLRRERTTKIKLCIAQWEKRPDVGNWGYSGCMKMAMKGILGKENERTII